MKYLSLFSGIEAATVAWKSLGWKAVAFAEFEDFPKAVLAHHYPNIPDLGDVTKITEEQIIALGPFDVLVGGSPCQDLSLAGKRAGMKNDDGSTTRSGLFDEQMRIFEIAREHNGCRYLIWENVPGAFSSNGGNDFAYILGSMVQRGVYTPTDGWKNSGVCLSADGGRIAEWRVLDAQYFGVPQRRRRIFIVLDTGAWWSRQPFLFEPACSGFCEERRRGGRYCRGN
jgi:DNA (cytosine-5)-methyltransferase 1